jgi:cell division protein FtsW
VEQVRGLFISLTIVLVGFGILMVHSASITSWPTEFERVYLSRHVTFVAIGALAGSICALVPARWWFRMSPWLFAGTIALLILVLVPGVGTSVKGAQRWFRFGPLSLQPSELAKIAVPLLVCRLLAMSRERARGILFDLFVLPAPAVLAVLLVVVEPDFGTASFIAAGCGIALLAGGWPVRYFVLAAGTAVPAAVWAVTLRSYQMRRIAGYLATWTDIDQAPYQIKQSLVTLGAGGAFGIGLGKGWQKLSFLPEANTDFVFAVVGEELGLVGTLSLVAIWVALYFAGLKLLCGIERRSFAAVAAFTLLTQLVLQATLNMAVVTALLPPKGIPHPLLSYGGSNLVVSLMSVGIIIGLTRPASVEEVDDAT